MPMLCVGCVYMWYGYASTFRACNIISRFFYVCFREYILIFKFVYYEKEITFNDSITIDFKYCL